MRSVVVSFAAYVLLGNMSLADNPSDCYWVEAERYAECNFEHFEVSSMGKPALLSGGEWIMKGMGPEEIKKLVPDEGVRLAYKVKVDRAGAYNLWARVGWFSARAEFEWRVDGGAWTPAPSTIPTRNLMELGFFTEASWAQLGEVELRQGENVLDIRYPKVTDENKRMLVALDCLAFVRGRFVPEGPFKPGQTYDTPLDRRAANQVFTLEAPAAGKRSELQLTGLWQVARYDDPDMDVDTYVPVKTLPSPDQYPLRWLAFQTPGSPWDVAPLVFGHRLIYRTRVDVPGQLRNRGFKLHFSGTNWIVSVFINGKFAGAHRGVWVPWDLDVSRLIEPGKVNEITVAVKGSYYAQDAKSLGKQGSLRKIRNRPKSRQKWSRWVAPIYPSVKGDGDGYEYGIVNPVALVVAGNAYTEEVFVKPSVANQRLDVDVAVRNTTSRARTLEVVCEAVNDRDNGVEKSFGSNKLTVPAGGRQTIAIGGRWEDAKLWWPRPNPNLYRLRTVIYENGKPVDSHEQLFGFREVTIKGGGIYINGVRRNIWNWVDVRPRSITAPEEWAEALLQEKSRFMRFSHGRRITQTLKTREERLEFYDRNGVPGRLCTMIDGMFISFNLGERTKDADGNPKLIPNEPVWENFREHMAQVAKAYRNHPSVILYQVENELVYINGMNVYGAYLDRVEELMGEVCEAGRQVDPTRPYTVGGGGDLSGRLEINSPHYPHTAFDHYPENAYAISEYSAKIKRWPWDRTKPWVVGESCFANELAFGAYVAGDEVFRGIDAARKGKAKWLRMLYGGYRWAGVAGFFPWDNLSGYEDARKIFSDLCAIPRKQTSRLSAGRENRLLFKVMNDTLSAAPVTLAWKYRIDGQTVASDRVALDIEPGFGKEHSIVIQAPSTDERLDGILELQVSQEGAEMYVDERLTPVLPAVSSLHATAPVFVIDRQGDLEKFLASHGLDFTKIDSLDAVREKQGLLLIGNDTLTPEEAFGPRVLGFAAGGGRVICLEQDWPLGGAGLPSRLRLTTRFGGYAHPQAVGSPVMKDLGKDDFIDWAGDSPTYKNAYQKPSQGGRSLAECGGNLEYSPLVELPCGDGAIVLCQLRVGAKLGLDPAADVLLRNFIDVYADYKPASGVVAVFSPDNRLLAAKIDEAGVLAESVGDLRDALNARRYKAVLVHAAAENLQRLNGLKSEVGAYQEAGGWIMLSGLNPQGMAEFNKLVGANHLLRPFRVERVTLENPQHPLAATLGNRDLALQSPKPLQHGRYWVSGETFSYVIDGRDAAPFTLPPGAPDDPYQYKPTFDDHDPYNFVNGMLSSDFWRYIQQIWIPEEGPEPLTFRFRRPTSLQTIKIWNNDTYWTIKDMDVIIDGDTQHAIRTQLPDSTDMTAIELPAPIEVRETVTLQMRTWRERPLKREGLRLVGIDNVQMLRPDSSDNAAFIDNVGGLVAFPRGRGGVFLNQLKFLKEEPRPENAAKKLRVLGVLLQNMGVGAASALSVAAPGLNVRYAPVNLQEYCTGYLDDKSGKAGWFGRKGEHLEALPRGESDLADVTYHVVDYATAPIPDCIILGGRQAPGAVRNLPARVADIPVGRKADLLFFLHTANVTRPITEREREQMLDQRRPFAAPVIVKYVLHYADGETAEIQAVLGENIDHWVQEAPRSLAGGRIAWSAPLETLSGGRAALYSMQARNPRPETVIDTIDIVRVSNRAAPAVIAITCGSKIER